MTVAAPPAEDQKLVQLARAAQAECRPAGEPVERFEAEVLRPLREWCAARADRVQAAYVCPPRDGVMWVFVVGRAAKWDFDLSEEVASFRTPLRDAGWKLFCDYIPAPADDGSLRIHFDPDAALLAHADR